MHTCIDNIVPDDAWVLAPDLRQTKYSYVQITDLIEVLHCFFDGNLDSFQPHMLSLPLNEWHPTNSLWGQVESNSLNAIIETLPGTQRAAIYLNFDACAESLDYLKQQHSASASVAGLQEFISEQYDHAIQEIADILHESL